MPSLADWNSLRTYLGGVDIAGGKMKEVGLVHWFPENYGADNSSGFTGFAAGNRDQGGIFGLQGRSGFFWSSKLRNDAPQVSWAYELNPNNTKAR
jgi:uncharacterized protein (TIGR02145 family)